VAAIGVGWWVDRSGLTSRVEAISSAADKWKLKADSAEWVVNKLGVQIRWEADGTTVRSLRMPSEVIPN
jgi:hypothetical protein